MIIRWLVVLFIVFSGGISEGAVMPTVKTLGYFPLPQADIVRIATDSSGNVYITNSYYDRVHILSNNGIEITHFPVKRPLGIAVDETGRVFVGTKHGDVSVYDVQGRLLYKLGSGDGEFGMPNDIATSSRGRVYVVDSSKKTVKVYNSITGQYLFSFGAFGFPTGIVVDEVSAEVYVADHNYARVRVYDLDGNWRRDIGGGGSLWSTGGNKLLRPHGLAVDLDRLYIAEAYHSVVAVYDKRDGTFLGYIGSFGSAEGQFKVPLDVAFDKAGKLFVSNNGNQRVEVLGIGSYSWLSITPSEIVFSLFEGGQPTSTDVTLDSDTPLSWTASVSEDWISVSPTQGQAPQTVQISVDPANLLPGTYTSYIRFTMSSGIASVLKVSLEVKPLPSSLVVAPSAISFKYQKGALSYPSESITISSTGKALLWSASASVPWLSIQEPSGTTPSTITASLNEHVAPLEPGIYTGKITINAVGASAVEIDVYLKVIYAGTVIVKSNIDEANFVLSGPVEYSGGGKFWSYDEIVPGTYTITFGHVLRYLKPLSRTFTIDSGQEIEINGEYLSPEAATHIVVAPETPVKKRAILKFFDIHGTPEWKLKVVSKKYRLEDFAVGDIDGDGMDEILVAVRLKGSEKRQVHGFEADGTPIEGFKLKFNEGKYPVNLASGDVDGDGVEEIVVAVTRGKRASPTIKLYRYDGKEVIDTGVAFSTYDEVHEAQVVMADVDDDGLFELVTMHAVDNDILEIRFWKINTTSAEWKVEHIGGFDVSTRKDRRGKRVPLVRQRPAIGAGDLNGDGSVEVVLAISRHPRTGQAVIKTYTLDGSLLKSFTVNSWTGINLAVGDIEHDGKAEIVIGSGASPRNRGMVMLYSYDGVKKGEFRAFTKGGAKISLGRFQ